MRLLEALVNVWGYLPPDRANVPPENLPIIEPRGEP